jgi:hypothetical protein
MKKPIAVVSLCLLLAMAGVVIAREFKNIREFLTGYEEVPAVSTVAGGEFNARISRDESEIEYTLSYSDLEGSVTQAHIHLGQPGVNGGISVWLCSNLASPPTPPGVQPCPPSPATVSGTIRATDVVGPTAQGLAPGEFAELIKAIRAGKTYVNVHSTKFPGGEVRSQIDHSGGRGDDHGGHK